jgi:glycosyltransferase involved in cell wall biosynthesis
MVDAEPLVSVIVPVLNGERHVGACISSILDQSYTNFELVIANNASTDRTAEIIASFDDTRIRVLPGIAERLDVHSNWTRAVSSARGEFVKIVCHDDLMLPECLAIQVGLLRRHPTAALVAGRRKIIDDRNKVVIPSRGLGNLLKHENPRVIAGNLLARDCTRAGANLLGEPVNVLIRTASLPTPLFDPQWKYSLDIEFYVRCLEDRDAVVDGHTLCCFRVSPTQMSASLASDQSKELRRLFEEIERRHPDVVSHSDVRIGAARARLLSQARRLIYQQMRLQAYLTTRLGRTARVGAPSNADDAAPEATPVMPDLAVGAAIPTSSE